MEYFHEVDVGTGANGVPVLFGFYFSNEKENFEGDEEAVYNPPGVREELGRAQVVCMEDGPGYEVKGKTESRFRSVLVDNTQTGIGPTCVTTSRRGNQADPLGSDIGVLQKSYGGGQKGGGEMRYHLSSGIFPRGRSLSMWGRPCAPRTLPPLRVIRVPRNSYSSNRVRNVLRIRGTHIGKKEN
ncbi:hypothetical protein Ancab_029095, partial [Ancistrocladus abbreviatus]